jgi:hypothetical protein
VLPNLQTALVGRRVEELVDVPALNLDRLRDTDLEKQLPLEAVYVDLPEDAAAIPWRSAHGRPPVRTGRHVPVSALFQPPVPLKINVLREVHKEIHPLVHRERLERVPVEADAVGVEHREDHPVALESRHHQLHGRDRLVRVPRQHGALRPDDVQALELARETHHIRVVEADVCDRGAEDPGLVRALG